MVTRLTVALVAAFFVASSVYAQPSAKGRVDELGDPLPAGAIARLGTLRFKLDCNTQWSQTTAVFSPDSKIVALVSQVESKFASGSCVVLWDAVTGKELPGPWANIPRKMRQSSAAPVFSADSARFLDVYSRMVIKDSTLDFEVSRLLWDIKTGKLLATNALDTELPDARRDADKTFVTHDLHTVIWCDAATHKVFRRWRPDIEKERKALSTEPRENWHLSKDGDFLLILFTWPGQRGGQLREPEIVIFDVAKGKELWRITPKRPFDDVVFSVDGKRVAIYVDYFKIEVRDTATGKVLGTPPLDSKTLPARLIPGISAIAFSADGNTLALCGREFVLLWSLNNPGKLRTILTRRTGHYDQQMTFSPDGKALAIASEGDLTIYDTATLKERMPHGHRNSIEHLWFSADGKMLITTSLPGYDRLPYLPEAIQWDVGAWKQRKVTATQMWPWENIVHASPNGDVFLGIAFPCELFDLTTGKPTGNVIDAIFKRGEWLGSFSNDGKFLAVPAADKAGKSTVRVYAIPSGKLLSDLPMTIWANLRTVNWGAFSPDGRYIAAASAEDRKLHVFETATGKAVRAFGQQWLPDDLDRYECCAAFSWDGKRLAFWDKGIRIMDLNTGKQLMNLPAGSLFAWSPDGRMMAVAEDRKICLWEVSTGKLRREISGHAGGVTALAFSPNGRYLASGSADTTVLIWDLLAP